MEMNRQQDLGVKAPPASRRPTCVDLFAGAGGFSLGMQQGGWDVVAGVEIDKWACDTLEANRKRSFPRMKILRDDVRFVTGADILARAGLRPGQVDVVVGGPPCQGFTTSNKNRSLEDPRSKLIHEYVRLVGEMRPKVFVCENVPGLLGFRGFPELVMTEMEAAGYVVRLLMMDACSYGVPQRRRRVFFQGMRRDTGLLPVYPIPTHFDPKMLEVPPHGLLSPAHVAGAVFELFLLHGHPKEEVKDLWWNTKLNIHMNKAKAADQVEQAIGYLIGQGVMKMVSKRKGERHGNNHKNQGRRGVRPSRRG